jgi:hypothetical protein
MYVCVYVLQQFTCDIYTVVFLFVLIVLIKDKIDGVIKRSKKCHLIHGSLQNFSQCTQYAANQSTKAQKAHPKSEIRNLKSESQNVLTNQSEVFFRSWDKPIRETFACSRRLIRDPKSEIWNRRFEIWILTSTESSNNGRFFYHCASVSRSGVVLGHGFDSF